jgi:pyridoxamine 5'-phosphate oxidase family protein
MSAFRSAELTYLQGERRLARLATVGPDGTPHITPVGMWSVDPDSGVVEVTGHDFAATKKFRDVARTGRAAIVVDDVLPPFQPRGVEIRGPRPSHQRPRAGHPHPPRTDHRLGSGGSRCWPRPPPRPRHPIDPWRGQQCD